MLKLTHAAKKEAPLLYCFRFPIGEYYHLPKGKYRISKSFSLQEKDESTYMPNLKSNKYSTIIKLTLFLSAIVFFMVLTAQAQEVNEHYIEVTGTSEIEIMPDKIHYIIEIREYFEEEFDGKSKPEEYHTKVPLSQIEQGLRKKLSEVGITQDVIRTQEIGDYWRKQGQEFF